MIPAGAEMDPFAEMMRKAREEQEPKEPHAGGRPRQDPQKAKQVTLYLRQDVIDWLREQVELEVTSTMSQAATGAIRKVMAEQAQAEQVHPFGREV